MHICSLTAKPKFSCPFRWKILTRSFSFGSRHCDKGQLLFSQALGWPGPTSQGKEKSGRCCWHLSLAVQPPRWESWQSLEPGQEIGEWGLTGPTAATKWNWETVRLPKPHPNLRNTILLFSSGWHMHIPCLLPTPLFFLLLFQFFPERGKISDSLGFIYFGVALNLTQVWSETWSCIQCYINLTLLSTCLFLCVVYLRVTEGCFFSQCSGACGLAQT